MVAGAGDTVGRDAANSTPRPRRPGCARNPARRTTPRRPPPPPRANPWRPPPRRRARRGTPPRRRARRGPVEADARHPCTHTRQAERPPISHALRFIEPIGEDRRACTAHAGLRVVVVLVHLAVALGVLVRGLSADLCPALLAEGDEHPRHADHEADHEQPVGRREIRNKRPSDRRHGAVLRERLKPPRMSTCKYWREDREEGDQPNPDDRNLRSPTNDHPVPCVGPEALRLLRAHAAHDIDPGDRRRCAAG